MNVPEKQHFGFTLAELLIALAILGVIATFTIPKVLQGQQDNTWNARAKETAAMLSAAYSAYKIDNTVSATTAASDLTPFMNYLAVTTLDSPFSSTVGSSWDCDAGVTARCLVLHNGSILLYYNGVAFGGTNSTNAIYFAFDPQVEHDENLQHVEFYLYPDGRITDGTNCMPGTTDNVGFPPVCPRVSPPWFSWDN